LQETGVTVAETEIAALTRTVAEADVLTVLVTSDVVLVAVLLTAVVVTTDVLVTLQSALYVVVWAGATTTTAPV